MDLTDFLLARIAEDEAAARSASDPLTPALWLDRPVGDSPVWGHIARWDSARVLAECEAKRRIVEGCADMRRTLDYYGVPTHFDDENILALLALPFADHADYQQKWSPLTAQR